MPKTPDEPTENNWEEWRKKPWAGRDAKAQEKPIKNDRPWKRRLKTETRAYEADPERYIAEVQEEEAQMRVRFEEGIAAKEIIVAAASADPELQKMQKTINRMARASGQFKHPPKLLIHTQFADHEYAGLPELAAMTELPGFIDINEFTRDHFLKHPDQFKAVMAHELAHIVNRDCGLARTIAYNITPTNQLQEVLADRMGAIIYGNPKEYAQVTSEYLLFAAKKDRIKPNYHSREYLSANGNARMLHKWAEILEREGTTDPVTGQITDTEKALDIFKRSK